MHSSRIQTTRLLTISHSSICILGEGVAGGLLLGGWVGGLPSWGSAFFWEGGMSSEEMLHFP